MDNPLSESTEANRVYGNSNKANIMQLTA